ncbi:MAG: dihydropyrimidinase [Acholeplasmatales bacterium]|nr:MAG: dihydropyrimidinase [Acholeplasmatales bacterium]
MYDLAIMNGNVYTPEGWKKTNIYVKEGRIAKLDIEKYEADDYVDATDLEVLPGIIDPHVHFELAVGNHRSVDDFHTGSISAAYGGVTSFIDFLDPVSHHSDLEKAYEKRLALAQKSVVDYMFHATLANPQGDLEAFVKNMKQLGIDTLKVFTTYSETERRTSDEAILTLLSLTKIYDFMLLVHVENDDLIHHDATFTHADLSKSRPSISETIEALKLAEFTRRTGGSMYMVHLSSGRTLEALKNYYPKLINTQFFIESCPQYFTFNHDRLQDDLGHLFTMAPPLRSESERLLLHRLVNEVYTIGTDHCSFMATQKAVPTLAELPLGVAGVEHALPVMRAHFGDGVLDKMTRHVAEVHRLRRKGQLHEGYDADIIIVDPSFEEPVSDHHGATDHTIYKDVPQKGKVISTMVRGRFVMRRRQFLGTHGSLIKGRRS